ncbi:MAG: beta-lactamase domain protein [Nocardioides sp.]|jgi:glyoxylase-like metal-dependent hydrolase (beta-lactamase superfamily II)|uniref:MBL fold metallo-hydrolase n=1 Tax=Nocardioides sp. TaxID=35761 RepID=UPI002622E404|nr:MBL fold metallo-hydrolase [Nocardioides sp.]MCW2832823.1 beta-lactamase domain protein [Nocardioides sp.]
MPEFTEVAPRVWVAHYDWMHVNITFIGGSDGLVMVDTHGSERQARVIADDLGRLGAGPLTALVNTHDHWDHWFGNDVLASPYADLPIHATEFARQRMIEAGDKPADDRWADHARGEEILATTLRPATHGFSSARALDLGDRVVELIHPGRGHTAGDLVVRVPDADVMVGGDLIEESDKPFIGDDSYPLEWPLTLDLVLGLMTSSTVVVPGHGQVVDRDFVQEQRTELGIIAETIRDLAGRGVPASQALAEGDWPWDEQLLTSAVRLGYEHLPRAQKRLPLV